MIHIFIGTKAQFIKMAPIMQALNNRGIRYNFIDAGQHAGLTGVLMQQFGLRRPDVFLRQERTNINSLMQALSWSIKNTVKLALKGEIVFREVFRGKKGICLIHGDTLTTLISLFFAKRCKIPVAHVEAGLRSYRLFNPFPEEIIRLLAMRFSDLLFAPSGWAYDNLLKMGYGSKSVNIGANTGQDAVSYAINQERFGQRPTQAYVVVTIHRVETIYSRSRLMIVVKLLEHIADEFRVLFVLHEPTYNQLMRFGLNTRIKRIKGIEISQLLPYMEFINLLNGAQYVITDGGSIQEECYYLNKPCMLMRTKTERLEGLNENTFLVGFDQKRIKQFFKILPTLKRKNLNENLKPSTAIADYISQWV